MADLDAPPAGPVEWRVTENRPGTRELAKQILSGKGVCFAYVDPLDINPPSVTVTARTAWLAHVEACPRLPGSPPFGSCRVKRVGGGK